MTSTGVSSKSLFSSVVPAPDRQVHYNSGSMNMLLSFSDRILLCIFDFINLEDQKVHISRSAIQVPWSLAISWLGV